MRARLHWRTIATLASVFTVALAATIVLTRPSTNAAVAAAPNPDLVPLDYADDGLRRVLDEYGMFVLGRGLDPIAPSCTRGSTETYRLVLFPGLAGRDFIAIDAIAQGGTARVEQREFGAGGSGAWRITHERPIDRGELNALRNRASDWLLSGKTASPGGKPIDVSEWYFEMCRRGRYHFAARYAADMQPDENREFLAVADALRGLRPGTGRK